LLSSIERRSAKINPCIYAHEDKLSGRCENALYDSAQQFENAIAALACLANECDADIESIVQMSNRGWAGLWTAWSPININLAGDYIWHQSEVIQRGKSRTLRNIQNF
jgi:hypothetical protein